MSLAVLVRKNVKLKVRKRLTLLCELFFPIVVTAILILTARAVPEEELPYRSGVGDSVRVELQIPDVFCYIHLYEDWYRLSSFALAPRDQAVEFLGFVGEMSSTFWPWKLFDSKEEIFDYVTSPSYGVTGETLCSGLTFSEDYSGFAIHPNGTTGAGSLQFFNRTGFFAIQRLASEFLLYKRTGVKPDVETELSEIYVMPRAKNPRRTQNFLGILTSHPMPRTGLFYVIYAYSVGQLVELVVSERESRAREMMRLMGLRERDFYFSWALVYCVFYFVISVGVGVTLRVGNVYPNTDVVMMSVLMWIYSLSSAAFGLFISTFFDTAKSASLASMAVYYFTSFVNIAIPADWAGNAEIFLLSIFPQVGFDQGVKRIAQGELDGNVATWAEIVKSSLVSLTLGLVLFAALFVYLDQVFPHKYGRSLHPLFLCRSRRASSSSSSSSRSGGDDKMRLRNELVEELTADDLDKISERKCVSILQLYKDYGQDRRSLVHAVRGVSFNIFPDEITVLLGENGAGKSSLIHVLFGVLPPTAGTAEIFGHDVRGALEKIRKRVGFCPQHDVLWEALTVAEHLELCGALKGLRAGDARREGAKLLAELGLVGKSGEFAKSLSGGMKRRLSVCMAFSGASDFVTLDEPTSGLDPFNRRAIWEILKTRKSGRALMLSTHFMDEAELLGDRVAVMSRGELRACGSVAFLKRRFGVKCAVSFIAASLVPNSEFQQRIAECVETHIAGATAVVAVAEATLTFEVPLSECGKFPDLFREIEARKEELKLAGVAVGSTKLEDVFMSLVRDEKENSDSIPRELEPSEASSTKRDAVHGWRLWRMQWRAQVKKRGLSALRDGRTFVCAFLVPLLVLAGGLALAQARMQQSLSAKALEVPADAALAYDATEAATAVTVASQWASAWDARRVQTEVGKGFPSTRAETVAECAETVESAKLCSDWYAFEWTLREDELYYGSGFFEASDGGGAGTAVIGLAGEETQDKQATARLVQKAVETDLGFRAPADFAISAVNAPFPLTEVEKLNDPSAGFRPAVYLSLAFSFIPATLVATIVREREERIFGQQRTAGLRTSAYWLGHACVDSVLYAAVAGLALALFELFQVAGFAVDAEVPKLFATMLFLYGPGVVAQSYCLSFAFEKTAVAQNVVLVLNNVLGFVLMIVSWIMRDPISGQTSNDIDRSLRTLYRLSPSFCLADGSLQALLTRVLRPSPSVWEEEVAGKDVAWLAIDVGVYVGLLCVLAAISEWRLRQPRRGEAAQSSGGPALVVRAVTKKYGKLVAVRQVSFAVDAQKTFCLLGVNGSGKTSLLRMCVGEVPVDKPGAVSVGGFAVGSGEARDRAGYCPQFDALIKELSVVEHLELFASLRGLRNRKEEIENVLALLDLNKYRTRRAGTLSGGNKRKLSVGIALIGRPQVLLMDEPSTGMDPVAKRSMWRLINRVKTGFGIAVVLSTHSMEEAEFLSDEIAIMHAGVFVAQGTLSQLRLSHSRHHEVTLQLESSASIATFSERVETFLKERGAADSRVLEAVNKTIKMAICTQSLSVLFRLLEDMKSQLGVREYSVAQYTLEQIFNDLARDSE